jgi:ribosomal-protein-alanine N-acetyltransferase
MMPERPPENIFTERLLLRKPVTEDAVPIFEEYAQDEEITQFLTWVPHQSIQDTKAFIKRCSLSWKKGTAFPWTIIRKADNQLLGMIEIVAIDQSGVNIGYVLARPFWGQGYMMEALQALIQWAMEQNDIYRVWAICDVNNISSTRVMEKSGLQKEGILRRWVKLPRFGDKPRDCFCYSIVK